ncbi:MAG: ATP-binding protein [Asticcacaulis sp.]
MDGRTVLRRAMGLGYRIGEMLRRTRRNDLLLGAGYALALLTTAFSVWMVIAAPNAAPIGNASRNLLILVSLNMALILGLVFAVGYRGFKLVRSREKDAGSRLHLRFVTMFALAAVTPAFVVALFFGVLVNRGIESWFTDRVRASVDNGAVIASVYVKDQQQVAVDSMADLAGDIDQPRLQAIFGNRLTFSRAMSDLLAIRGGFDALYIIDRDGRVLARGETIQGLAYVAPPPEKLAEVAAENTVNVAVVHGPDAIRVIRPLSLYEGAQLYGVRLLPKGMIARLRSSQEAIEGFREADDNRARVQTVFAFAYIETVLLVLIGAVWVGTSAAESIAVPVARLVQAADRVASGDLEARVETKDQSEDIAVLSRAFNRMTSDLDSQQRALRKAGIEAEERRRFIETVLSGVSAGVVGLDAQSRISAINGQAARFLALSAVEPGTVRLAEAVPELAALLGQVSGTTVIEEEVDIAREGETRRLRVRASALDTGHLVLTFDDITRLVTAQRNAAWRDVARRIAHEIKNPLTPIQLSAERLRRKYRDQIQGDLETFDRCTDTIIRQVAGIGRMVDEFSSFARMPAPKFATEPACELLRAAVFAQRVAQPDITIDLIEPLPDVQVTCDGRMLGQALTNVLKNAGEAVMARRLQTGETETRMRAELRLDGTTLSYIIEDDGIGLPEKDRDRLTEPYVTTREKGTGLGLAIVKRIMEDHGGDLKLTDAVTLSGARAVLRLPLTLNHSIETEQSEA